MHGSTFATSAFGLALLQAGLTLGGPVAKRQSPGPAVSEALFDQFKRYATFSAAAYADDCPHPPFGSTIVHRIDNTDTDTQGFIARDDAAKEIIIAFRGTSDLQDFGTDFSQDLVPYQTVGVSGCAGCTAHEGFLKAWNSVAQESIDNLKAAQAANPGYNITVTGHSLGASIASLATPSLLGSGLQVTTFTFGQPRTGNPAYADFIDQQAPPGDGKLFRVTHANDGVPQTIPTSDGYRHHSTEFWQKDQAVASGTFQCSGQEPADCNNSERGTGLGANGIGINAAHLEYLGVSTGNPLDKGAQACGAAAPGLVDVVGGLLGLQQMMNASGH